MSGYAATARIERASVRPVAWRTARQGNRPDAPPIDASARDAQRSPRTLEEALTDLRTAWAQTTFYLFDPESWR